MKITLNVREGLVLLVHDVKSDKPARTQGDVHTNVDAPCSIQLTFEEAPGTKPMNASAESGASGSLSFA